MNPSIDLSPRTATYRAKVRQMQDEVAAYEKRVLATLREGRDKSWTTRTERELELEMQDKVSKWRESATRLIAEEFDAIVTPKPTVDAMAERTWAMQVAQIELGHAKTGAEILATYRDLAPRVPTWQGRQEVDRIAKSKLRGIGEGHLEDELFRLSVPLMSAEEQAEIRATQIANKHGEALAATAHFIDTAVKDAPKRAYEAHQGHPLPPARMTPTKAFDEYVAPNANTTPEG